MNDFEALQNSITVNTVDGTVEIGGTVYQWPDAKEIIENAMAARHTLAGSAFYFQAYREHFKRWN